MNARSIISIAPLLLLLAHLAACTAPGAKQAPTPAPPHKPAPSPAPAPTPTPATANDKVSAADLKPLEPRTWRIVATEGKLKGKTFEVSLAKTEADDWKETTTGVRSMTMRRDGESIVMPREEDVDENVAITYDPPFVLLPADFAGGKPHEAETMMTVYNLKSGSKRDSGRCRYSVQWLGKKQIETPAGTYNAYAFRTVREIDLSLAKVSVTIETDHVPDVGIVRTHVEQRTKAVGIFTSTKVEETKRAR